MAVNQKLSTSFHLGQNIDVLDSVGKWTNAEVLFAGNGTILIHYTGYSLKYDQSIDVSSPRILTQWEKNKQIQVNNRIDAYHPIGGWLEARVLELGEETSQSFPVKVHYFNYHPKYDRWVDLKDNNEVAIIGSRSKAHGIGKKRRHVSNQKLSQMIKKLLDERAKQLGDNLQANGWFVKNSGGDGNCLFRSISDQLYGTQEHHALIRKTCMDYIEYEKQFFRDYVVEQIQDYIDKKRVDGTWGDDVQIQAISEIYSRPIQIYVLGNKPIRTFHQENEENIEPIRLAYVGACHYDSIKAKNSPDKPIMPTQCGQYEEKYQSNMSNILKNRDYFSNCNKVEDTVGEQLFAENRQETKVEDELNKALEVSQTEAIMEQIQKAELNEFQNQYEQQKIQEQLRKMEEKQIEEAKKLSKNLDQPNLQRPYWFGDLLGLGYSEKQIWFAIEIKGFDPDAVQNFLLDNMCI